MKTFIDKSKVICYYYGLFKFVEELSTLNINTKLILKSLSFNLIMLPVFNSYGIISRKFEFCKYCITPLQNNRYPKYGSINKLFWASCQLY